jgi:hypothetical protein
MVSSVTDAQSTNLLAGVSLQKTTPSGSTNSFTEQLMAALEGYLAQSGNGSNLEIDVKTTPSQDSGVRQFIVTVKNPDSGSGQPPAAASATGASASDASATVSPVTFPGFASVYNPVPPGGSAATPAVTSGSTSGDTSGNNATPATTPMTEIDAYWAAQPLPVQQLRNIPDLAGRNAMAQQLADQGYTVDKAIMVWGWDPLKTMLTRKMYGYTWAPSFNQGNVSTPGITLLGQTPYDPKNSPPGSIAVNTDFAKGTQIADSWSASQLQANT